MKVRFLIAIGAVGTAAVAGAQPDKDQHKTPAPSAAAPVVLASASDVRRPATAPGQASPDAIRRPAPRITTCRCGDVQATQDEAADEQPDE